MWEHKSITDKNFRETGRIQPNETYIQLMDYVETQVMEAQAFALDDEQFLQQVPNRGPWENLPESDTIRGDPRTRYIGQSKARFLNTNLILGSTWIENERFNFERRINTMSDFIKQKTVMNANMWTPKQLVTTQTIVFCSNGDEDRMGSSINEDEGPSEDHMFLKDTEDGFPEWEALLWSMGHKGVVPGSDPQNKVYWPSLMHRNVSFNNRLGWVRYSPEGFGKDANGYLTTRPFDWIWPAVDGRRDAPSAFNILCNLSDRRVSFGEEGITDIYLTTGKTSIYSLMGMMNSGTVRRMFGAGSDLVPLEMHLIEQGIDEWISMSSDEDRYSRLFEVCATIGYLLTDPQIQQIGGANKRRRLLVYPFDQGNLLTCTNASQVADHSIKENYQSTVFTKLDQADFQNRQNRRIKAYADLVTASSMARGSRWISQATLPGDEKTLGPNVHTLLAVRGYETLSFDEYMDTFNPVSAAPERLMRRAIQTTATNALKTLFPMDQLGENTRDGEAQYQHIFDSTLKEPLIYYTEIRFLIPTSIDKMRYMTGSRGADRGKMREIFAELTGADPVTALSILDLTLPFLADLGSGSWQTGTGLRENEIIMEVTLAVNPSRVWKNLLEPTTDEIFQLPKGKEGTAANVWGDVLMANEQLHQRMEKDGLGHYLNLLKMAYHWSNAEARKRHDL